MFDGFTVENRGLSIAVHRLGSRGGAPVLALHGFLDHGRSFARTARLAPGLTLFAPDARGHGCSGWIGEGGYYHFYDYLDDLQRALPELPEPMGLVGHSMGGTLALTMAALRPRRFSWVLLLEGMGPPSHDPSRTLSRISSWLDALRVDRLGTVERRSHHRTRMESVDEAAGRLSRLNPRLAPDHAFELASSFTEAHPDGGVTWRFDPLHRTPSAKPFRLDEAQAMWTRVEAPVVSLWGERGYHPDGIEARHRWLPRVEVGVVPGAGHNLHHERPELVAEALTELSQGRFRLPSGARPAGLDLAAR